MSETQTGGVSDDPGRIIYDLEEQLKDANATAVGQSAEIERLKADNEQLRSANEYIATLERLLDDASDNLRELREDREATERHCDGAKSAFLAIIKTLWEIRR